RSASQVVPLEVVEKILDAHPAILDAVAAAIIDIRRAGRIADIGVEVDTDRCRAIPAAGYAPTRGAELRVVSLDREVVDPREEVAIAPVVGKPVADRRAGARSERQLAAGARAVIIIGHDEVPHFVVQG